MKDVCTCPTIVDIVDDRVRPLLNLPARRRPRGIGRPRTSVQQVITQAIAAQDLIGWDLFLRGFVATEREQVQALHSHTAGPSSTPFPPPWGPALVQQVVTFGLGVWKHRNEALHGVTLTEKAKILWSHVLKKVDEVQCNMGYLAL